MSLEHVLSRRPLRHVRPLQALLLAAVAATSGCGSPKEGSLDDARAHLTADLDKWVGGRPNDVDTMEGRILGARPASYTIESLVRGEPHLLASLKEEDTPNDEFKAYPTYRANVTLTFKSMAGTTTNRIATFSVTWSEKRKKWYDLEVL